MSSGKKPQAPNASGEASASSSGDYFPPARGASGRPGMMTVGSGTTSENARRLAAMLDDDSGYGGSILDGESIAEGWHPGLTTDRPTPDPAEYDPANENERRVLASHIHQLYYNQNKNALGRAINETVDALKKLQEMNSVWPAHYPSVQRTDTATPSPERSDPRPGLHHTQSTMGGAQQGPPAPSRPTAPRRAGTSIGEASSVAESSSSAATRPVAEPRLVTPQLAQDFSILKIDLKMGSLRQTELVHSLEKGSIAALLDGQIQKSIHHLFALRERIDDTSSKVLVTGDLNAGKSTFCNALLRRKVLPEDQQPCTSIFCEVLDCRENAGVEEVHAIPVGQRYNRDDERTYSVFAIRELEKIVIDDERWSQCKIYIKDIRAVDESLLNNGVVDIALIDAPGLNKDSVITTANFAKQEEIDVVVFVVSAANHFTESAKEFVFNAAREKAYMFIVVNGFDAIKDKKRAQEMILKQVHKLSPATFKESSELVHFVSSNAIPVAPAPGGPPGGGGSSGGGSGGSGGSNDPENPGDDEEGNDDEDSNVKHGDPGSPIDKNKGKEKEKIADFEELESSLRRFVLEKRARSKLAPAKTYLMNLLGDLANLANVNRDVAHSELDRVNNDLAELVPQFEQAKKANDSADKGSDQTIEDTVTEVYSHTRDTLNSTIRDIAEQDHGIIYPGVFSAFQYAEDLKYVMLQTISDTVGSCEEHARQRTVQGVNMIKNLGLLHLGNSFPDVSFRPENMFRRKRDALARQVDVEVEFVDFFDFTSLWERQEKVAGTSMAVTVAGVVGGRLIGGVGWLDGTLGAVKIMGVGNLRRLVIPGAILTGTLTPFTIAVTTRLQLLVVLGVSYAVASIPQSLPRRISNKLHTQLGALDYTHANATRISSEVRRALKYPADNLRVGLKRNVEKLQGKKEDTDKLKHETQTAAKYFVNLITKTGEIRSKVQRVDLEGPAPGVAAGYDN
jgi:replication fork clamp-binding protein CrfC